MIIRYFYRLHRFAIDIYGIVGIPVRFVDIPTWSYELSAKSGGGNTIVKIADFSYGAFDEHNGILNTHYGKIACIQ